MATRAEIERAIEICEYSRLTHVKWSDYLRQDPSDPSVIAQAEIAGDDAHHVFWIERYDRVLKVLRDYKEETDGQ